MTTLQQDIDALQVKHLGPSPTKEQMSDYFNTLLNSACGPIGSAYGHVAVWALLKMWTDTAAEKARAAEKGTIQ
jgi:hypothetical protein